MDIQASLDFFEILVSTKSMDKLTKELYENAIKVLQKQIPKKPIQRISWKSCPLCGQGIGVNNETVNPKTIEYCYHCGQKLDWE